MKNALKKKMGSSHMKLWKKIRIGTWNVRTMSQGKLDVVKTDMERTGVELLGLSEIKWTGMGHFTS